MFQTTKHGEQEYIPSLEITQSQSTVLFKLQKQLELNSTMLSVSSWMVTEKLAMWSMKMEIKLTLILIYHMYANGEDKLLKNKHLFPLNLSNEL
jgi:hypothetical protein